MVLFKKGSGKRIFDERSRDSVQLQRFSALCNTLRTSDLFIEGKQSLTESLLSNLVAGIAQYYQTHFGKGSPKPHSFTIPAAHLFLDFSENGSLFVILSSLLVGASIRDLVPLDAIFENPPSTLLPIFCEIDKNLALAGFQRFPAVFLNSVPFNLINKLSKIVIQHGATLVSTEDKATHVVDWNEDIDKVSAQQQATEAEQQTCRILEAQPLPIEHEGSGSNNNKQRYLVHWLYEPDSMNEWTEEGQLQQQVSNQELLQAAVGQRKKAKYFVACRYILDCDVYNEWGNESDYENVYVAPDGEEDGLETAAVPTTRTSKGVGGSSNNRKSRGGGTAEAKDKSSNMIPLTTSLYEKLFADVIPASLLHAGSSNGPGMIVSSTSVPMIIPAATAENSAGDAASSSNSIKGGKGRGNKRKHDDSATNTAETTTTTATIHIPEWFSMDTISVFERRLLASVIQEHTTVGTEAYIASRNGMIQFSALHPFQYLSVTDCRRKLSGDVGKIARIHEFLDAFGLINTQVKLESRPNALPPQFFAPTAQRQLILDRLAKWPSSSLYAGSLKEAPTKHWTKAMDEALKESVQRRKLDWLAVSKDMLALKFEPEDINSMTRQEYEVQVHSLMCMIRFTELHLTPNLAALPASSAASSSTMQASSWSAGAAVAVEVSTSVPPAMALPTPSKRGRKTSSTNIKEEVAVKEESKDNSNGSSTAAANNGSSSSIAMDIDTAPDSSDPNNNTHKNGSFLTIRPAHDQHNDRIVTVQQQLVQRAQHMIDLFVELDRLLEVMKTENEYGELAFDQTKQGPKQDGEHDTAMEIDTEDNNHHKDEIFVAGITNMARYFQQALATELRRAANLIAERQVTLNETIIQHKLRLLEEKVAMFEQLQSLLSAERERLEIDKREFHLQKVLFQTSSGAGSTLGVGGGSAGALHHSSSLVDLR